MAVERMPVTPEVITWARERLGYSLDALATKRSDFKRIADWESGESRPTYRQLEKLAKDLWLSIEVFFFPEPPDWQPIEKTFRTLGSQQIAEIPPAIRILVLKARAFQVRLAELNDGRNPAKQIITRAPSLTAGGSVRDMAAEIRDLLEVTPEEQFGWRNHKVALKSWRKKLYSAGVYVFKDSFGDKRFCGFSLYDDHFPIIYINNSNPKSRQIFTAFHELAHLVFRNSGIHLLGGFQHSLPTNYATIEAQCNALANAVLVPADYLDMETLDMTNLRKEAARLSKRFSVSREVIYRNFRDRGHVDDAEYTSAAAEWARQVRKQKGGGGDPNRTHIAYLGDEYIALAFRRYEENRIDEEDLADYLALRPSRLGKIEELFFRTVS